MDMDETGDGGEGGSPPEFMEMNQSKSMAGIISRIRVENFMCHSSLEMEFSECVNFITGQNGSGKSAILTALCVAFGIKAKGTQRASSLKDFIKNGCSYALVVVEMRNEGEDAFKPEIYGNKIIIERRINESSSTTTLKDQYGKKVSQKRDDLHELVEYLNIDVENPCVIMTQDKSREFLHSGNDKEKFKFFFRATLLQQVNDLLRNIQDQLEASKAVIDELEESIRPAIKELENLREKIKGMEYLEEMAQEIEPLRKKLAWSYVYEIDKQIEQHRATLEKLESRIPSCQQRIDKHEAKIQELEAIRQERRVAISQLMGKTEEIRRSQDQLQQNLTEATKEKVELEEELTRRKGVIESLNKRIHYLQQQITDIQERHVETSQAEQQRMQERFKSLEEEIDAANLVLQRLQQEEKALEARVQSVNQSSRDLNSELEDSRTKLRDIKRHIDILRRQQTNKVTAFGGERVLSLLQMIERRRRKFFKPPIGPIGAHVSLVNQDWALAIEHAIGKLLNSFIVTNHKDALELRACARESSYPNLQILIYDFDKPLLDMPERMLPDRSLQTVMSAIKSDNTTIINVLIDQGNMERQVLVENYDIGRKIAFESHSPNVKEVFTREGMKMFSRGYVQTTLPPDRRIRGGRLCAAIEEKIAEYEDEALKLSQIVQTQEKQKQTVDMELRGLKDKWNSTKRHLLELERNVVSKNTNLRNLKSSADLDSTTDFGPNVDELEHEISRIESEIQSKEDSIEKLRIRLGKAQQNANDCKAAFDGLCGSAKDDIAAFKDAEQELINIEDVISNSVSEKKHYEGLMNTKVLPEVETAKRIGIELQTQREENYKKALIICPVAEVEALGGCQKNTPAQLSAQIRRLEERLKAENQRYPESIDDLRRKYEKQENKISKKKRSYDFFRLKLNTCQEALERRRGKLRRNAQLLRRQLTWQFNGHLNKKGISGHIKVNFSEERLSVEVKMPQDNSTSAVRDTRGLSGGERSFSTLCFALALHEMTEAPFRAMDEFDVFMDAVSRKISLDTVVDFAIAQGSQWIFITPHDIGMVKSNPKVRKQQMPAPRP